MISEKFCGTLVDLTLGASGSIYTAPANGWFWFARVSDGSNTGVTLVNDSIGGFRSETTASVYTPAVILPANKNDSIRIAWMNGASDNYLRFYYADGSYND